MGHPTIFPTGTTIYKPNKCASGYTIFQAREHGAMLINMNGKEEKLWKNLRGCPNKMLPNGHVLGQLGERDAKNGFQEEKNLVEVDWNGNVVYEFNKWELVLNENNENQWIARQHHDFQREGNPVGYYSPELEFETKNPKHLILVHRDVKDEGISKFPLLDDSIIEVDSEQHVIWEWNAHEHFNEMGFSETQKRIISKAPNMHPEGFGDWIHINSMSEIGPNKNYNEGHKEFHPNNIIVSSREANLIFIIDKKTKKIVWKIGPNYEQKRENNDIMVIGCHHPHIIPKGLPGAGNLLVFDNGGWAGYGLESLSSENGNKNVHRDYSRVLEINPITFEIIWEHTAASQGYEMPFDASKFYSPYVGSAQRLINGNTLICEGSDGRLIEATKEHEIVWEYISPYWGKKNNVNQVYRAYRVPYDWVKQLKKPVEKEIKALDVTQYRVPNAAPKGCLDITKVKGAETYKAAEIFCVLKK